MDTREVDDSSDTPDAQLTLKPFPQVPSGDGLADAYSYFEAEENELRQTTDRLRSQIINHSSAVNDHLYGDGASGDGLYPIQNNTRQIYALLVLQSYYEFKFDQLGARYRQQITEVRHEHSEKQSAISDEYYKQLEVIRDRSQEAHDMLLAELFASVFGSDPPELDEYEKIAMLEPQLEVNQAQAALTLSKDYANQTISLLKPYYSEMRQMVEEYWLHMGGLLKYITNQDVYQAFALDRKLLAHRPGLIIAGDLSRISGVVANYKKKLEYATARLDSVKNSAAEREKQEALAEEQQKQQEDSFFDLVPDIEKEVLTVFPESGDLGEIGFEGDLLGLSAALTTDGDAVNLSLGAGGMFGGGEVSSNLTDRSITAKTAIGVQAEASTLLNKGGAVGAVKLGVKGGANLGGYVSMSSDGKITDRGVIYTRETGGSLGPIGRTEKTVVRKSHITGVASKTQTVKYSFWFGTYERPVW